MIPGTVSRAMAAGPACLVAGLGAFAAGHGSWRAAAPMPIERTEVAAAALAGRIYVIGGFKMFFVGGVTNAVQEYDPVRDLWRDRAPLPEALHHAAAAALDGKLYVGGGDRDLWTWKPRAAGWGYASGVGPWGAGG